MAAKTSKASAKRNGRFGPAFMWFFAVLGALASAVAIYQFARPHEEKPTTGLEGDLIDLRFAKADGKITASWRILLKNNSDRKIIIRAYCSNIGTGDNPEDVVEEVNNALQKCKLVSQEDAVLEPWKAMAYTSSQEYLPGYDPFMQNSGMAFVDMTFIDTFNGRPFSWTFHDCRSFSHGKITDSCMVQTQSEGKLRPGVPVDR